METNDILNGKQVYCKNKITAVITSSLLAINLNNSLVGENLVLFGSMKFNEAEDALWKE